ncbi:unnamed protein product, partial [Prorocentrum cordatum]
PRARAAEPTAGRGLGRRRRARRARVRQRAAPDAHRRAPVRPAAVGPQRADLHAGRGRQHAAPAEALQCRRPAARPRVRAVGRRGRPPRGDGGGDAPPASGVARRGAPAALSPLDAEALAGPSEDSCGPGGLEVELAVLLCDESEEFGRLPPDVAVFFCCEVASLCTAVHQDALAARLLWRARRASEALPGHHPLAVAPWAGLCRVALHAGHHDAAARAALRARSIREQSLGPDTLETATAYNNLACCLHALGRPYESSVYLEIAAEVMRELAGEDHPRAQVVVRNLGRARSEKRRLVCDVPHLFALPVKAPAPPARRPSSARPGSARRAPAAAPA